MSERIRIGIVGYGNVGRGVEAAIAQNPDMELYGVFTRRNIADLDTAIPMSKRFRGSEAIDHRGHVDVMVLCGGSAADLPMQGPYHAGLFNVVDSFDTHAKVPEYFSKVDAAAKASKKVAVISTGWDPGLFSLVRVLGESALPKGAGYTFWGDGVSQGHGDAVRQIEGVADARQYTLPVREAVRRVRAGETPDFTTREKHTRLVYVVAEPGADLDRIRNEIVIMPHYFADYDTEVRFITAEEMERNHSKMPHGGFVFRTGFTGTDSREIMEFSLNLESNPEFTAGVMAAYARAAHRLNKEGQYGARTVLDIAPGYLHILPPGELRRLKL